MALATRRAMAARPGGIANVSFTTLGTVAEDLGAQALSETGRQPASPSLIAAGIRAALHQAPGVFEPVASHPATQSALAAAYRELRRIPDAAADAVAECSNRASDVVRICREIHAHLSEHWYDAEDLLTSATAALTRTTDCALGPLIVHLLPEITAGQAALMHALAKKSRLVINIGLTGSDDSDAPVLASYGRYGITPDTPINFDQPPVARIISTSDADEEVRAAVRLIMQWAQDGVRLGRMAVLYGNADPYARLVHEHLGAAGIAFTGMSIRSLGYMLLGRTLLAILALPDRDFRRPDVLGILANAPVRDDGQPVPSRAWERISREAGVVGGDDWSRRLPLLAASKRERAEQAESIGNTVRAERYRREADRTESLASFVEQLRQHLARGQDCRTWAGLAQWAIGLIRTYLGEERLRVEWPEADQDAATRVEDLICHLAELDRLAGDPPTFDVFRQALETELTRTEGQVGRFGSGVLAGHISIATGLLTDRVVLMGMAEGCFPPRRLEDSLLPDSERAAAGGELKLRSELVHDDHRHLLAAIAGSEQAVLSWPRGDLRQSNDRPASRWLLDDAGRLAGVPGIRSGDLLKLRDESWFESIASFADGLNRTAFFANEQELRLAAVARGELSSALLTDDATLSRALDVIERRASDQFTRFDGNVTAARTELAGIQRVSATQLQTWAICPRAYLFKYLFGVEHIEEPERQLSIDALDRGTLFHAIVEQLVRESIDSGRRPTHWSGSDRDRLHDIAHLQFEQFQREGRTGRKLLWHRDKSSILSELDRMLERDNLRLLSGLRPVAVEQSFDLVELTIQDGRVLHLYGSIDRIDQYPNGAIEIIDYKTGAHSAYRNLNEETPHDGGKRLQLFIYALAGRQHFPKASSVNAYYWFTKADRLIGYPVTESVEREVTAAINQVVAGIESGVFPAHPSEKDSGHWVDCWYCTPDGLSSTQLRREWERKRRDPALTTYAQLCEPEEPE